MTIWNSADKSSQIDLSNDDLTTKKNTSDANFDAARSVLGDNAGKFYCELRLDVITGATHGAIGLANGAAVITDRAFSDPYNNVWVMEMRSASSNFWGETSQTGSTVDGWAAGDIVGIAFDFDNNKIWFSKNGAWLDGGDPSAGTGENLTLPTFGAGDGFLVNYVYTLDDKQTLLINALSWTYPQPTGFLSFGGDNPNDPDPDPTPENDPIVYPNPGVTPPIISAPSQHAYNSGDSWSIAVSISAVNITSQLKGKVKRTREKNAATTITFTIIPDSGVIDAADWIGRPVTVDYTHGSTHRLFTGRIETTDVAVNQAEVTFFCTDNYQDIINGDTKATIAANVGGYYSERVFNANSDNFQYMQDLVSTRPVSYDLDSNGSPFLAWLAPEVTPHFTFNNASIDFGSMGFKLADRSRMINRVIIKFPFDYQRLRHRERYYHFYMGHSFEWWLTTESFELPTKQMITDAVTRAGWAFKPDSYEELPQSGVYFGANLVNLSHEFVFNAWFWVAKRFTQTIVEDYEITIDSPQSQTAIGLAEREVSHRLTAEYDSNEWEEFEEYVDPVGVQSPGGDWVTDATDREIDGRNAFNNDVKTAQALEQTRILNSHRNNLAWVSTECQPELERFHTVFIDYDDGNLAVQARGTVYRDELILDPVVGINDHKITIYVSKTDPSSPPADPGVTVPVIANTTDAAFTPSTYSISSYLGGHTGAPVYNENWEGFIGNWSVLVPAEETYERLFNIRTQPVGAEHRDELKVLTQSTVNIPIPDELFTITRA